MYNAIHTYTNSIIIILFLNMLNKREEEHSGRSLRCSPQGYIQTVIHRKLAIRSALHRFTIHQDHHLYEEILSRHTFSFLYQAILAWRSILKVLWVLLNGLPTGPTLFVPYFCKFGIHSAVHLTLKSKVSFQ
jgi:hypothetical protein